ncbi:hypothetical protein [Priestia megaterium]|uniref:hypothetical protein n=1 Tax=Priestia megaterium TaxID=1404 RepID=UPI003000CF69
MENRRVFPVREHFLVEIDEVKPNGNMGLMTYTWSWDVYIASNTDDEYKGMAIAREKNVRVPWTTLTEHEYFNELINLCELRMQKHPSF